VIICYLLSIVYVTNWAKQMWPQHWAALPAHPKGEVW